MTNNKYQHTLASFAENSLHTKNNNNSRECSLNSC